MEDAVKTHTLYIGFVLALLLAACAGSGAAPTPVPTERPAAEISSQADLVAALQSQGATVEPADAIEQAFFRVSGQIIRVNGVAVQVFEYADEAARKADSDLISPDGTNIGTTMVTWVDTPNFWAHGRLIVLFVGSDAQIIVLLQEVLGDPLTPS
jgi:hypothetical protein